MFLFLHGLWGDVGTFKTTPAWVVCRHFFQEGSSPKSGFCLKESSSSKGVFSGATLPKFNIAPEKLPKPNRKGPSSNDPFFRGELLNFGGATPKKFDQLKVIVAVFLAST